MWTDHNERLSYSPARPKPGDDARAHAFNWFVGVTITGMAVLFYLGWLQVTWGWDTRITKSFALAPICAGAIAGSIKLIQFTTQSRNATYPQPIPTTIPTTTTPPTPTRGTPLPGTMLRGVDGTMRRVETQLSEEEIRIVKTLLTQSGKYNVRALMPFLGDRASSLRQELHKLGILTKPKSRAAAKLTPAGRKAIMRW